MSQQSTGAGGGFLAGLVVGAVAGVAIGLLIAPRSGEETRDVLVHGGIELKGRLMEGETGQATAAIAAQPVGAVEGLVGQARAYLMSLVEQARATWRRAVDQGKEEARRTEQEMLHQYERQVRGQGGA